MTELKSFWESFSDHLGKTILHPQYFAEKYAWEAVEIATKEAHGVLLDIGCGRMPYRDHLLPKVEKYIGLDHPTTAKLYHGEIKPDMYADATEIPLKTGSIDTILLLMVLEHLPNPLQALKEAKRLLASKKGILVLSTVQMYPIHDAPFDYFRYTRYGLDMLLKEAGFKIKKIRSQGNFWSFWGLHLNVYLFQTLMSLLKNKKTLPLGLFLSPFFYSISIIINVCVFIPDYLSDGTKSRFNISHVVSAAPK